MNVTTGMQVARTAFVANHFKDRMLGLLSLPPLQRGEGLLIERCRSVHTFGMRYAIDVAFISHNYLVIKVLRSVTPRRITSFVWRAARVLELPAGTLNDSKTQPGHQLLATPVTT